MTERNEQLWEQAARFHGHVCPGLAIGFRAALYAAKLLDLSFSADEEVVCIAENDACGVDAVQVLLGCTVGKGNLLFHIRGKQAFSFYDRKTGAAVRLVLNPAPPSMTREETLEYCKSCPDETMFSAGAPTLKVPEQARIFDSFVCDGCGELTGANWIRIAEGKKLCLDCRPAYDRFRV